MNPGGSPVLLSKTELLWLLGDTNVSKSFEYKIKSNIKRKIQTLTELELPLLVKNNFFATNDNHHDKVDDSSSLGWDLESGPSLSKNSALVRQRSLSKLSLVVKTFHIL
jgi:hypothetical protein